ncbi:Uncharacterized protein Fot_27914 [Forsythia ovata]|uniref:Uncharacterized protein n=1 Tax=Forsythia ovata TaxID=205694 RepID=A0ABD1TMH9_9LAMI
MAKHLEKIEILTVFSHLPSFGLSIVNPLTGNTQPKRKWGFSPKIYSRHVNTRMHPFAALGAKALAYSQCTSSSMFSNSVGLDLASLPACSCTTYSLLEAYSSQQQRHLAIFAQLCGVAAQPHFLPTDLAVRLEPIAKAHELAYEAFRVLSSIAHSA